MKLKNKEEAADAGPLCSEVLSVWQFHDFRWRCLPFPEAPPIETQVKLTREKSPFLHLDKGSRHEPLSPDLDRISVFMAISMQFRAFHNFMMPRCEVKAAPEVYKHPALKDSMTEI